MIERDPIVTAKEVASVDRLSGGRFLFGVGAGWNAEEMANHGTDSSKRFGVMRERIEAMKAIWTEEEASYSGRYVNFERIWCWPKPLQQPHPPVLVGGNGRRVLERVVAFGDEWMPNRMSDEDTIARVAELQSLAADAGRGSIPVTVVGMKPDAARIERVEQGGVHRVVFWLPAHGRGEVESSFDSFAAAAREYAGGSRAPDAAAAVSDRRGPGQSSLDQLRSAAPLPVSLSTNFCQECGLTPGSRSCHAGAAPCGCGSDRTSDASMLRSTPRSCRDATWSAATNRGPTPVLHHDPVEDVELGRRDDVFDGADLLAVGGVHEHALLEDLVGNRQPLVYHSDVTLPEAGSRRQQPGRGRRSQAPASTSANTGAPRPRPVYGL